MTGERFRFRERLAAFQAAVVLLAVQRFTGTSRPSLRSCRSSAHFLSFGANRGKLVGVESEWSVFIANKCDSSRTNGFASVFDIQLMAWIKPDNVKHISIQEAVNATMLAETQFKLPLLRFPT